MSVIASPLPNAPSPSGEASLLPKGILLTGIGWRTYEALLADLKDRPIRLTFDRGSLEIMAPTFNHERCKRKIGRVIETLAEETNRPIISGGSTTFRREDLERGLEPDDCFYVANVAAILGKEEIDLRIDPPPDLALEIEISRTSLDRMSIYAALGIPELWRFNGLQLQVFVLQPDGAYSRTSTSSTFAMLDLAQLEVFLSQNIGLDDGGLVKAFRSWLKPFLSTK